MKDVHLGEIYFKDNKILRVVGFAGKDKDVPVTYHNNSTSAVDLDDYTRLVPHVKVRAYSVHHHVYGPSFHVVISDMSDENVMESIMRGTPRHDEKYMLTEDVLGNEGILNGSITSAIAKCYDTTGKVVSTTISIDMVFDARMYYDDDIYDVVDLLDTDMADQAVRSISYLRNNALAATANAEKPVDFFMNDSDSVYNNTEVDTLREMLELGNGYYMMCNAAGIQPTKFGEYTDEDLKDVITLPKGFAEKVINPFFPFTIVLHYDRSMDLDRLKLHNDSVRLFSNDDSKKLYVLVENNKRISYFNDDQT